MRRHAGLRSVGLARHEFDDDYFHAQEHQPGAGSHPTDDDLKAIGIEWDQESPPAEFWKKYDAGQYGKPDR